MQTCNATSSGTTRRPLPLLRLVCALIATLLPGWAGAETLQAGAPAPGFALPDAAGKTRQLADWRGQWLALYFYPRDNTPGCTTEAANFRDAQARFAALKAQVVGISLDAAASHRAFAAEHRLPFTLLSDAEGAVAARYGALLNLGVMKFAKRHSFLIDPDGRIARIYRQVEPATHVEEILADLQQLRR
jgi:peroxiredoxin Q/BCP